MPKPKKQAKQLVANRTAQPRAAVDSQPTLAQKLGPRLRDAIEAHLDDQTTYDVNGIELSDPFAGPLAKARNTALAMSEFQHDTPARRVYLEACGIDPNQIHGPLVQRLAAATLQSVESQEASEVIATPWEKGHSDLSVDEQTPVVGLNTRRLSDVSTTPIDWQRVGVAARGKLTLISGPPNGGKTYLAMDHTARLTTGRAFPGETVPNVHGPRNVLIISSEDGDADTIKPRIEQQGGDPSRVFSLQFVIEPNDKRRNQKSLMLRTHMPMFYDYLRAHPMIDAVIIDPITAVLGTVDSHRDADVRSLLGPLCKLAEQMRVSIIAINHHSKTQEGSAINRSIGSIAFVAAARIAWQVVPDRDDPGRSLFLPVKMNLGPRPDGRAFRITDKGLIWDDAPVRMSADDALNGPSASKRDEAKEWLRESLKDGPVQQKQLEAGAKADGISWGTVRNAKNDLGVEAKKQKDGWFWALPDSTR